MRKISLIVGFILLSFSFAGSLAGEEGTVKYFTLDNGLQVLLQKSDRLSLVHLAFAVDIGSRNEEGKTGGLVHILEHLVFMGSTEHRNSAQIIADTRAAGCHLNAHTDHDLMTLEASFPTGNLDTVLQLVEEKIFSLKWTEAELDREKKIITEEIARIQDDPMRMGTALALQALFPGHGYGRPVFGKIDNIMAAGTDQLAGLYRKYFVPGNCSLCLVGPFDLEGLEKRITRVFGEIEKRPVPPLTLSPPPPLDKDVSITREMDVEQAYLILGFQAPRFNHEDYFAVDLFTHIIGRGVNPLLYSALRGRVRLAEGISIRYIPLEYGGAVLLYILTEPGRLKRARRETLKFLKRASSFRYSKQDFLERDRAFVFDYLESAKNQAGLRSEEARETGLNRAIANARYLLMREPGKDMKYQEDLVKLGTTQIREAASKYFGGKKHATIALLPLKKGKKK